MRNTTYDVIVAGGGVIGASIAWRLGQEGRRVLLLEKGEIGMGASSAAAGMLGAQLEMDKPGPQYQLGLESRSMYRSFANELFEETGIDIQMTDNGTLRLAHDEEEAGRLRRLGVWQSESGARAQWLTPIETNRLEPLLGPTHGALHLPDDGNIAAPLLSRALAVAARIRTDAVEGAAILSYGIDGRGVVVNTLDAVYHADFLVLAAGAWSGGINGKPALPVQVGPVKGQLLSIRPRGPLRLHRTAFAEGIYLVPKRDGSIIAGATEERDARFQRDVTLEAVYSLLKAVRAVAPELANAAFERAWTGFRPATPNSLPLIGADPAYPQFIYAVGHYRNGILLAPVTGNMATAAVAGRVWPEHWRAFLPTAAKAAQTVN
ncbi:MAG: glycine oxidase ThiO [Bacilli bacterium]